MLPPSRVAPLLLRQAYSALKKNSAKPETRVLYRDEFAALCKLQLGRPRIKPEYYGPLVRLS